MAPSVPTRPARLASALVALAVCLAPSADAARRANHDAYATAAGITRAASSQLAVTLRPNVRVAGPPAAFVASRDAKRGVPTMLWAGGARSDVPAAVRQDPERAARLYVREQAARYAASPASLGSLRTRLVRRVGDRGRLVAMNQVVDGIEVFQSRLAVMLTADGDLVAVGGNLHEVAGRPDATAFAIGGDVAIALALSDLYGAPLDATAVTAAGERPGGYTAYDLEPTATVAAGLVFTHEARARRVWFPLPDRLEAAFYVEVSAALAGADTDDAFAYVIGAETGDVLYRANLVHDATYRVWTSEDEHGTPAEGPIAPFMPHPTGLPDGAAPAEVAASLVTRDGFNEPGDPWLKSLATELAGNNVDAYVDRSAPDGYSNGDLRATATAPSTYDHAYDLAVGYDGSDAQQMAALVQMFYVINWLHDWYYDSGFDEAAGNGQASNYGRGGLGGDAMNAELDALVGNNANMSTPADGTPPRMQMGVWKGVSVRSVTVNGAPVEPVGAAGFGPQAFDVTAEVALAADASGSSSGCHALSNDVAGRIVAIDRGSCQFAAKVAIAEQAGAVGVIIMNDTPGAPPPGMGGTETTPLTIGALSITYEAGDLVKQLLDTGPVVATLTKEAPELLPSSMDSGIVSHEWGHYLHHRLAACGSTQCAGQSEGWGDFVALHMLYGEGGPTDATYATGAWLGAATVDNGGYYGIRRYPYSTDTAKNPLTFKHIQSGEPLPTGAPQQPGPPDNAEVHNTGEVWSTMMWEAYMALMVETGGPDPRLTFAEARRRMSDYVVAGMMLAPANPTFTEQRDGVLAAAAANDPLDLVAMAEAFARRGAGTCAVSPERHSKDLIGVVEAFELQPQIIITGISVEAGEPTCDGDDALDAGEGGTLVVTLHNAGHTASQAATVTTETGTEGVSFPEGATATVGPIAPLQAAVAEIPIALASGSAIVEALFEVTVTNAGGCSPVVVAGHYERLNVDTVPGSSTADSFEAADDAWTVQGDEDVWARAGVEPGSHVYNGLASERLSDSSLVSPALTVSADEPFVVRFTHAHQFEVDPDHYYDGGVVELSTDDGGTWDDVSAWVDPGYIGEITDVSGNVLALQSAFVGLSADFPALLPVELDFGSQLAGETVRLRFRIGTDQATGDLGWFIDDVEVAGITNLPFASLVPATGVPVYLDTDGDGHGGPEMELQCPVAEGTAASSDDCDDSNEAAFPGAPELCDGTDNDCDGLTDEGWPLGGPCVGGIGACAQIGAVVCGADGASLTCSTDGGEPFDELCDGLDNDCDGTVDNGFGLGEACDVGVGECIASGVKQCGAGGAVCSAVPLQAAAEACDGLDNDCDGQADEGLGLGEPCTVGMGACAVEGVLECGDGGAVVCGALPLAATDELCDGLDNDCDGETDEGFGLGDACEVGVGACGNAGVVVCTADGSASWCSVDPLPAGDESCDGLDNDCDGAVDNGFGLGDACAVGVGACAATGVAICGAGGGTTCSAQPLAPVAELCDGVDNDCDGETDEGATDGVAWFLDDDGDGWGAGPAVIACDRPSGYATSNGDCDDADATRYPSAPEDGADGIDHNCDGAVDEPKEPGADAGTSEVDADAGTGEDADAGTGEPDADAGTGEVDAADGPAEEVDAAVGPADDDAGTDATDTRSGESDAPAPDSGAKSGGCSTSGAPADQSWPLLLLVLGALGVWRTTRRIHV